MNTPMWSQITVKNMSGSERVYASCSQEDSGVSFRYQSLQNGYACYVSATEADGFDGQAAIRLVPQIQNETQYVALAGPRFWLSPHFGDQLSKFPEKVQGLLTFDGTRYTYYLPLCADTFKTVIRGCEEGFEFLLFANCGGVKECNDQLSFICVEGKDPLTLMREGAKLAAELLDNGLALRGEKKMSDIFRYIGWCSWDALMFGVSHETLLQKADEFRQKGVPIGYVILDDMWADVPRLNEIKPERTSAVYRVMHESKLRSLEGDPKRFPNGVAAAVKDLKQAGIPHVGIWFPATGYWSGFDPNGKDAKLFEKDLVKAHHSTFFEGMETLVVAPNEQSAATVFDTLCARIKSWGCDLVKIDNQSCQHVYRDTAPVGVCARALHHAIDRATEKHFDGALINCMGMFSESMFNRTSTVSRCSDDFQPEKREWFAKNLLQSAYNGLLQGQFYVNDWDMWWTDDGQAAKNSLCRAISGGPVYVSDQIGRTNPEILKPLILRDGRLLLCDESATPTADCIIGRPTESGKIFKIRNRIGNNGVVAVFNIDAQNQAVSGTLSAAQTGVADGDYVYYEYFSGDCGVLQKGECLHITLKDNDDFRLYTFVPYNKGGVTPLGRTDLFMGVGAIEAWDGKNLTVSEGGKLAFYAKSEIELVVDGRKLATSRRGGLVTVCTEYDQTSVLVK